MPKTYYDSELTGAQIESALEAIHGVVTPSNNGKVLYIDNGQIKAASASRWGHGAVLEPLSVTANGDYTPPTGADGFDSVHVAVPGATLTTKSITQNGTYNASSDNADGYSSVTVNVSGGGSAVVQPLSVTQNGTYNPPSGVDGYAPVTVNVSGGSNVLEFTQNLLYDTYNTNVYQTEPGGIYLWGSAYNGGNFTNADIICGNTNYIVITAQYGRALCIIKSEGASVTYNRSGGVYYLSKINSNVPISLGSSKSWASGNEDRSIEIGHLYMFMGPNVSTETPGTFTGATVVSHLMQGDASHGYHHGAVILATANTLGYSVSGTNYLAEIGLYSENEYHVIT